MQCCVQQRCVLGTLETLRVYLQQKSLNTTHEGKRKTFRRNVRTHKPSDTASYPRRIESSGTLSLRDYAPRCVLFQIFELSTFSKYNRTPPIRIIGRASHQDKQKFRMIGCFFPTGYSGSLSGKKEKIHKRLFYATY